MSKFNNLLDLQVAALEYLDVTRGLEVIREQCAKYTRSQERAFQFTLLVDPADLLDLDAELGNLLLHHPGGAAKIFQEVVFVTICCLKLLPQCSSLSQVLILLRLQTVPPLPCYTIVSARTILSCAKLKRMMRYTGVVIGHSTLTKYTRCARYLCPLKECPGSEGNKYIRLHIPGAKEAQTVRGDFLCTLCGQPLIEDMSARLLGDKLVIEMADEESLQQSLNHTLPGGHREDTVTAFLRDDLTSAGIEIGKRLTLFGMPLLDLPHGKVIVEVNNIKQEPVIAPSTLGCSTLKIQELYEDRKSSPWSFTLSLAYAFGGSVSPAGTFLNLKLGMLLALAGMDDDKDDSVRMNLLAVGTDSFLLHRLMSYGTSFASRTIHHSSKHMMVASVCKDRHGACPYFIEGGSLLLAGRGVCFLGSVEGMKKATQESLQKVMEQGAALVDIPHHKDHQTAHQVSLPVHCGIWAYTDSGAANKVNHDHQGLLLSAVVLNKTTQALADMFGMVYFTDIREDSYADYMVIHQQLMQAMGTESFPLIEDHEFHQYLSYIRKQPVRLGNEASQLIQNYYVTSRSLRASSPDQTNLPVSALKVITNLCLAHAKLRQKEAATVEDAVIAIYLYEESCTVQHGQSALSVQPMPHVRDNNVQAYIGQERDAQLRQFQLSLEQLCSTCVMDVSTRGTDGPEE